MLQIEKVVDGCYVTITDCVKIDRISVNCGKFANQKWWIGKSVGDIVYKGNGTKCKILKIEQRQTEESDPLFQEWRKVDKLLRGETSGRKISLTEDNLAISRKLRFKKSYGTTAREIYERCITYFGFNPFKKELFAPLQPLYAQNCTKEGYSVWMLPNSNLTGKSNGSWANFIEMGDKEIVEYSFAKDVFIDPSETRVVFAKQENGEYVFLGVYYLKDEIKKYFNGKCTAKTIWKLASENYPEDD